MISGPNTRSHERLVRVLYIDGNEDDLILTQLSCERCQAPFQFVLARSVTEAIAELKSAPDDRGLPDLVILEILIQQRGFEVLEFMCTDPRLAQIPVVAFTGTGDPNLHLQAQSLGARRVVEKEASLLIADQLVAAARDLGLCP